MPVLALVRCRIRYNLFTHFHTSRGWPWAPLPLSSFPAPLVPRKFQPHRWICLEIASSHHQHFLPLAPPSAPEPLSCACDYILLSVLGSDVASLPGLPVAKQSLSLTLYDCNLNSCAAVILCSHRYRWLCFAI